MKEKLYNIQKGMGKLKKDTKAFKYKYATLEQIQEKMNPLLEKNKLMLVQPIVVKGGQSILQTTFWDLETDSTITSEIVLPSDVPPQDMGSAITYYRRYSVVSFLNLEQEDDDGKKATDGYNYNKGF